MLLILILLFFTATPISFVVFLSFLWTVPSRSLPFSLWRRGGRRGVGLALALALWTVVAVVVVIVVEG
jgi:hypothetical protein